MNITELSIRRPVTNIMVFVSLVVIVETAWALRRFYLYERSQIASALRSLLNVAELEIESAGRVRYAEDTQLRMKGRPDHAAPQHKSMETR